jgi:hypothetical protein
MTCPVDSPKAHESKTNSRLMVVPMILLDRHIPINGISCRERGDAVRIDRIVVGMKTGNVFALIFINSVNILNPRFIMKA